MLESNMIKSKVCASLIAAVATVSPALAQTGVPLPSPSDVIFNYPGGQPDAETCSLPSRGFTEARVLKAHHAMDACRRFSKE